MCYIGRAKPETTSEIWEIIEILRPVEPTPVLDRTLYKQIRWQLSLREFSECSRETRRAKELLPKLRVTCCSTLKPVTRFRRTKCHYSIFKRKRLIFVARNI